MPIKQGLLGSTAKKKHYVSGGFGCDDLKRFSWTRGRPPKTAIKIPAIIVRGISFSIFRAGLGGERVRG